jgi:hypothetical protein
MSRTSLAIVLAVPLLLALVSLTALVRLAGSVEATERSAAELAKFQSAALESLAAGRFNPSSAEVAAALNANFESAKAERKLVSSLWSTITAAARLTLAASVAHVLLCLAVFRKHHSRESSKNAL